MFYNIDNKCLRVCKHFVRFKKFVRNATCRVIPKCKWDYYFISRKFKRLKVCVCLTLLTRHICIKVQVKIKLAMPFGESLTGFHKMKT